MRDALTSPFVPIIPDMSKDYTLEIFSYASVYGTGAVLTQDGRPVAYTSATFSPAEHNYTTGEQELSHKRIRRMAVLLRGGPRRGDVDPIPQSSNLPADSGKFV